MSTEIRCDLCELHTDVRWIFTIDTFTVVVDQQAVTYPQNDAWGVCQACRDDIEDDEATSIMARRHRRLLMTDPNLASWPQDLLRSAYQVLDVVILGAITHRHRDSWRAYTASDRRQAQAGLDRDGERGAAFQPYSFPWKLDL